MNKQDLLFSCKIKLYFWIIKISVSLSKIMEKNVSPPSPPPLPRNFLWPLPSLSREVKKIPLRKTSKIFGIDITRIKGYSTRAASSPWADAFFFLSHLGGQNVIWIFSNLRVGVYFLEKYERVSELVAFAQNWGILQTRLGQSGDHMKMNLTIFKYKNECYKQLEWKK